MDSPNKNIAPTHFVWAGFLLLTAFLGPAFFYWSSTHTRWAACLYGNASCSLTFATYFLSVIGLATLIAAGYAATFAKRACELEREVILSLGPCVAECQDASKTKATRHDPYLRISWHLGSLAAKKPTFEDGEPADASGYRQVDFDCFSILANYALCVRRHAIYWGRTTWAQKPPSTDLNLSKPCGLISSSTSAVNPRPITSKR